MFEEGDIGMVNRKCANNTSSTTYYSGPGVFPLDPFWDQFFVLTAGLLTKANAPLVLVTSVKSSNLHDLGFCTISSWHTNFM